MLAERVTALGGRADGTARTAAMTSRIGASPLDIATRTQHLAAVADRLAQYGKSVRAAVEFSTEWGDADTADLFTEISRAVDKQLWFVEAHLQADD